MLPLISKTRSDRERIAAIAPDSSHRKTKTVPPGFRHTRGAVAPHVFTLIAAALFALQGGAFLSAKFSSHRYFCWAPYDQHTRYEIAVTQNGKALTATAIEARYHLPAQGTNPRSTYEILGTIERFESTYGRDQDVTVTVTYRVNGGSPQQWNWPLLPTSS